MRATKQQKRWAFGNVIAQDKPVSKPIHRRVEIFHSKGGYGWRLVGCLGEEYARGWARRQIIARKAGNDARTQFEEKEQKLWDRLSKRPDLHPHSAQNGLSASEAASTAAGSEMVLKTMPAPINEEVKCHNGLKK